MCVCVCVCIEREKKTLYKYLIAIFPPWWRCERGYIRYYRRVQSVGVKWDDVGVVLSVQANMRKHNRGFSLSLSLPFFLYFFVFSFFISFFFFLSFLFFFFPVSCSALISVCATQRRRPPSWIWFSMRSRRHLSIPVGNFRYMDDFHDAMRYS